MPLQGLGTLWVLTASLQAGSYQVGVAPSTVKVMIAGASQGWPFEGTMTNRYDLYLARGEHQAMQVVVIAATALTNAQVAVSAPQEVQGAGPLNGAANAWLVGHVNVNHVDATNTPLSGQIDSTYLPGYRGWFPDPLLTFTNICNITNAGDRVPFWIDVSTLREATAGDYVATITVSADNSPSTNVQLDIHVWDFQLPLKASLPTVFSAMATLTAGGGAAYLYGSAYDETQFDQLLLDRRMGVAHIYKETGRNQVESFSSITNWAAQGQSAMCLKALGNGGGDPCDLPLTNLYNQVSGAGLLGMSYVYGFDEVDSSVFPTVIQVFNQIHASYPGLRTMTTAQDPTFGASSPDLRAAVDIWVPTTDVYNQAAASTLRGLPFNPPKDVWWYISIWPYRSSGYINFMVEQRAIEPRLLLGLMTYKYQADGFLYYNVARWLSAFHTVGGWIKNWPRTDWDARSYTKYDSTTGITSYADGDGCVLCAGPDGPIPTIRSENIRDGLQDYDYLNLLENLVKAMQAVSQPTPTQVAWLSSAQQLLVVPSTLVASVTAYTTNTTALESYREQLAAAILTGQTLTQPPRTQLTIAPASTGNVRLLWPTNPAGFNLEASTNVGTTNWSDILPAPMVIGTNNVVTNALDTPRKFYRLRYP